MPEVLINVDVDDLSAAESFYVRAFGLRPGRRFGRSGVELLGAQAPIYLLPKAAGTSPAEGAPPREYRRHWTPVHLDFAVDDLEAACARAEEAGARRESPIADHAWGRIALYADPFGHGFCLLQFKGRGYDEIASS